MKSFYRFLPAPLVIAASLITLPYATAQDSQPGGELADVGPVSQAAERDSIAAERARLTSTATNESIACYKKFFVNNCLDVIRVGRQQSLADLRLQEIALDRAERQAKAAEQLREIEEKSSPQKQQESAEKRAAALKDYEERMARETQKINGRATVKAKEQSNREATGGRAAQNQGKAAERTRMHADEAESARQYRDKLEKADERRARNERERLNRVTPSSKPLPVQQ